MEILEVNGTPLTNHEVRKVIHKHFNERMGQIRENKRLSRRQRHKDRIEFPQELVTVENNLHMYCKQYPRLKCQTEEDIREFLMRVEHFGLTLGEKIQFINCSPTTLVEVHLLIDNCISRYAEEETVELLRIVNSTLARNLNGGEEQNNRHELSTGQQQHNDQQQQIDLNVGTTNTSDISDIDPSLVDIVLPNVELQDSGHVLI